MKQSEIITTNIGCGAVTIMECSNDTSEQKIPSLTILQPAYQNPDNGFITPAHSMELGSIATNQLYQFLKKYYEES
jgi:hypothetical protein